MTVWRVGWLTAVTMVGFATNSLICRFALGEGAIDPATYTGVRLVFGAATLSLIAGVRARRIFAGNFASAAALFGYAAPFSFAYLRLGASTGSLLMCCAIQATMIGSAIREGTHPRGREWIGLFVAAAGLVGLTLPGLSAPDPVGALLMAIAGISWGIYSLRGRAVTDPLVETAGNFLRALPFAVVLLLASLPFGVVFTPEARGVGLAAVSGILGSGIAYTLWYVVVPSLGATRGAIVQLSMPAIAATGGVLLLGEPPTMRLLLAGIAIIGGVGMSALVRSRSKPRGQLVSVPVFAETPVQMVRSFAPPERRARGSSL